jgi:hypothetical protein
VVAIAAGAENGRKWRQLRLGKAAYKRYTPDDKKECPFVETIVTLHARLANTIWLYLLILGLWSLWRAIRGHGLNGNFLGALAISQMLIWIQAIFGGILFLAGQSSELLNPSMHYLYAGFSLVFLPFAFLYWLRGDDSNRGQWVMSFAVLFQFGTIFYRFGPLSPI